MSTLSGPADPSPLAEAAYRELEKLLPLTRQHEQEAYYAAKFRDPADLAEAAEKLLPLHAEFARLYRTWLAARQGPGPA